MQKTRRIRLKQHHNGAQQPGEQAPAAQALRRVSVRRSAPRASVQAGHGLGRGKQRLYGL